jgi:hypothetical protein
MKWIERLAVFVWISAAVVANRSLDFVVRGLSARAKGIDVTSSVMVDCLSLIPLALIPMLLVWRTTRSRLICFYVLSLVTLSWQLVRVYPLALSSAGVLIQTEMNPRANQ